MNPAGKALYAFEFIRAPSAHRTNSRAGNLSTGAVYHRFVVVVVVSVVIGAGAT
jgi:hypothetical protein